MSAPPPLPAGVELAPGYEVMEHLRRGRALDVYDVWSEARGCRCIVKALRPDRMDDQGPRQRLIDEGRLLGSLTHPHIVRGYETLEEPGPMVVMETLAGETLSHMIEERGVDLAVEEVAHLGLHLASAIRYLHAHAYLHLDLKPSNVIAENGRAKVIDLSVARAPGSARAGVGTWLYMAPEQARGGTLGPPADVWGIGVVLFEAATGEPAFADAEAEDDEGEELESDAPYLVSESVDDRERDDREYPQLTTRAARVEEVRPLPGALGDLVAACLEPEPALRPTVLELLAALEPLAGLADEERRFGAPARRRSERAPPMPPPAPSTSAGAGRAERGSPPA